MSLNYFFKKADENFSSRGGETRIFLTRGRDVLVRGVGRNDFKNNSNLKKIGSIQKKISCKRDFSCFKREARR